MITNDKVIKIFCATDVFRKKNNEEFETCLFAVQMGRLAAVTCMKNKHIPLLDKIMFNKRYVIKYINNILWKQRNLVTQAHVRWQLYPESHCGSRNLLLLRKQT